MLQYGFNILFIWDETRLGGWEVGGGHRPEWCRWPLCNDVLCTVSASSDLRRGDWEFRIISSTFWYVVTAFRNSSIFTSFSSFCAISSFTAFLRASYSPATEGRTRDGVTQSPYSFGATYIVSGTITHKCLYVINSLQNQSKYVVTSW